jgi:hypothetical protein
VSGPGFGERQATECSSRPGGWAAPLAGSDWISTRADCGAGQDTGTYTYTVRFNLPNLGNIRDVRLAGSVLVDDSVDIRLNDQSIASRSGSTSASTFEATGPFRSGENTLAFVVSNSGGGPTGLDFVADVTAAGVVSGVPFLASGTGSAGADDPNVRVSGPGIAERQATVCSSRPAGWGSPVSDSAWISTRADCDAGQSTGEYRYTIRFRLRSLDDLRDLRLAGSVLVDDTVDIRLNYQSIFNGGGAGSPSTFETTDRGKFRSGENTLVFVVNNSGGGPTGLDFAADVTANGGVARVVRVDDDDDDDDDGRANHGRCVREVARNTPPGPGHGAAVSYAARVTCRDND